MELVHYGTVTFWVEGSEDDVHAAQERIQKAVADSCGDLPLDVSEDVGEYEVVG